MNEQHATQVITQELLTGRLGRREFIARAAALGLSAPVIASILAACGGAAPTAAPVASTAPAASSAGSSTAPSASGAPAASSGASTAPSSGSSAVPSSGGKVAEVARNKTVITVRGGTQGKFTEADLWNPFLPTANHQLGAQMVYEPLAYYSAFTNKTTLWLAESFEYTPDFMQLTIKTRQGIKWSDGEPFSAEDVAYTFNQLVKVGSKVKWGADVAQFLDSAKTTDANTAVFKFKVPAPRFFEFITYKFDIGVYIAPKHIFESQDWTTFTHFDIAKGWPVTTSPWKVVYSAPEQKVLDRRDSWWGVAAGVGALPMPERCIYLPDPGEQGLATGIIANQYDIDTGLQPATFPTVFKGNAKVTTWTGQKSPFGQVDWWPHSLYLNNTKAPYNDPNVRWAISSYLDRGQIIDVAWSGASYPSTLFLPNYPGLKPFIDAAQPMLEQYPILEYNPKKGDDLLTKKGWKKDGKGMWQDETGKPVQLEIISFFDFTSVGPVVVEQLKRSGIDATYAEPPNFGTRFSDGDYTGALYGHGGSYSSDIYYSLRLYQTASEKIPGGHLVNFSLWKNPDYDKLVDQLYGISPTETAKTLDIWKKCLALWLPDYPDIQISQGLHRLPMNTTNWKGWPTAEDPYINPAHFHLTWPLVMHKLQPAQ